MASTTTLVLRRRQRIDSRWRTCTWMYSVDKAIRDHIQTSRESTNVDQRGAPDFTLKTKSAVISTAYAVVNTQDVSLLHHVCLALSPLLRQTKPQRERRLHSAFPNHVVQPVERLDAVLHLHPPHSDHRSSPIRLPSRRTQRASRCNHLPTRLYHRLHLGTLLHLLPATQPGTRQLLSIRPPTMP